MHEFMAIDFETGNPKRVSACALGYAKVVNGEVVASNGYLVKPVGGHAAFQSKIHGIKAEDTDDRPDFGSLFPEVREIFSFPLVAHSLFDKQVLAALSDHFDLRLNFEYVDTSALAKRTLPALKNHKLKTLAMHFELPTFRHHDAREDAIACANIYLKLQDGVPEESPLAPDGDLLEFHGLITGILADDEVDYKEAYALLYWLEDHETTRTKYARLYATTKMALEDDNLDDIEANDIRSVLVEIQDDLGSAGDR